MKLLWKSALALIALAAIFLSLFFAVGLARPLDDIPRFGTSAQNILITNVTIVDLERGELVPSRFVAIEKGMIKLKSDDVLAALAELFVTRGPPAHIRSDNVLCWEAAAGTGQQISLRRM